MREEAFTRLRALYQDAKVLSEGGCELVHLSAIKITVGSELQSFAALLCPQSHSGYATRLFLDRPVPGKGANWRSFPLLGKTWWAAQSAISPPTSLYYRCCSPSWTISNERDPRAPFRGAVDGD